jgi:hypothetical protein
MLLDERWILLEKCWELLDVAGRALVERWKDAGGALVGCWKSAGNYVIKDNIFYGYSYCYI